MPLTPADHSLIWRIWSLTWPMVVYNLLEWAVGLVDLAMVRSFGSPATAALGIGRQVTFLIEAIVLALTTGIITLVSQAVGAGTSERVNSVVRHSLWLVLLLGVPTGLAGYLLSKSIFIWMRATPQTLAYGQPYLQVYFAGIIFLWGNLVGTALFRGWGDAWTPLKLALGVNLLHVGLNYLFIFGAGPMPAFEVQGAAVGTVAARACGTLAWLIILGRSFHLPRAGDAGVRGVFSLDFSLIARMLRIGIPMALAGVLRHGSRLIFLAIVGACVLGERLQAAVGVGMQMRQVSIVVALGFQIATASLVGQALGRGDLREAEILGRRSFQLLALIMGVVVAIIFIFAWPLASLFIDSPQVAELGATVLRWFAVAQLFSALNITLQGALMGAGDTAPAMRYTLISEWGLMLSLAILAVATDFRLPDSLLAAWTLAPLLTLILMQRRWRGGAWKAFHDNLDKGATHPRSSEGSSTRT